MKTPKRTRTHWARLSVDYYRDPKIIAAGPIAEAAYIRLLALARGQVEVALVDGAVPLLLAERELREVTDLWDSQNSGGFTALIGVLEENGLLQRSGKDLVISGYSEWQTTRDEIEQGRLDARARQQAVRARQNGDETAPAPGKATAPPRSHAASAGTSGGKGSSRGGSGATQQQAKEKGNPGKGEEAEMGVYDSKVEAFADLRDSGAVKKGSRKVGKHGLNPTQVADAERIVDHLAQVRKDTLGGNFRITDTWWADVRKLLNGTADTPGLTVDQACDLIDYALSDKFWHAHCQTPAGLVKHGGKLFHSDDFVRWSKAHGRPEANRPRNTLVGEKGKPSFRGGIAADQKVDWSQESEAW